MRGPDARAAGFTLLEALVALAILSGVIASVMTLIGLNRRAQAEAETDLAAALHARTLLARIGRDLPLETGTQSGTFDDGTAWSVLVRPFRDDAAVPAGRRTTMFQIQLRLQRGRSASSAVDVVTLRRASR
jgi:general secretion pathway protein I